jgi:hypothetical protein
MVDNVVMNEKAFPGGDVNTGPGCLRWVRDDQLRRAREQAGSIESIPDGGGKCKDSVFKNACQMRRLCFV